MGSPAVTTGSKPQTAVIDIGVLRTIAQKTVIIVATAKMDIGSENI